jgi:hypothetical protein
MANGYIVAAEADIAVAREIADGFGLDLIAADAIGDNAATAAALAQAENVGLVLSLAAAEDANFAALMRSLASQLASAQLILITPEARAAFDYLPQSWPVMPLEEAQQRARALSQQRHPGAPAEEPTRAAPLPPAQQAQPQPAEPPPKSAEREDALSEETLSEEAKAPEAAESDSFGAGAEQAAPPEAAAPAPAPAPATAAPTPPPHVEAPRDMQPLPRTRAAPAPASAPADATAFAPKRLRRGTPELVQVAIHQPKDLQRVIKTARARDKRTEPVSAGIGDLAIGASVGVALDVRGAAFDGAIQRQIWTGAPLFFGFDGEADAEAKQATFIARVFINDAQIGMIAFVRPISGPAKQAADYGDKARMKRHKRVFLSYSSKDREVVAAIATAYESAGVPHFWDRASLKSGEEWSPRLRREIERADLFHLCWSKAAAESEWVEKEAEYALTRRRRAKRPDITVQMLDGPPWAKHPPSLDSINFDDFVRAAIVGYARGDGPA